MDYDEEQRVQNENVSVTLMRESSGFSIEWDAALPRIGDNVLLDGRRYEVTQVDWILHEDRTLDRIEVWAQELDDVDDL